MYMYIQDEASKSYLCPHHLFRTRKICMGLSGARPNIFAIPTCKVEPFFFLFSFLGNAKLDLRSNSCQNN